MAASLALLALASSASAATTAGIQGDTLVVTGDADPQNVEVERDVTNPSTTIRVIVTDARTDGIILNNTFPIASFAKIRVDAGGGDDFVRMDEGNGAFTDTIPTTMNGGDGNDKLIGGNGAETIEGGAGDDQIDPNHGNDIAVGGPGNDSFTWDPGDGSDTDDGGDGVDELDFNGSNVNEKFNVFPDGSRVVFTRDVGTITMDLGTMERVRLTEEGGTDTLTAAPGLGSLVIDADGGAGTDTFNGSDEPDVFTGGTEDDVINGGGGADTLSGGGGNDTLHGDDGDDTVKGDENNDQLFGDAGTDALDGGDGADTFHCGGPGDTVAFDASDLISGDCLPFPTPPAPQSGSQGNANSGGTTTVTNTTTTTAAAGGAQDQQGTSQPQTVVPTGLAAGTRGFGIPKVRASGANLKVTLVNTAGQPIDLRVSATEKVGRKTLRLGSAAATLAANETRTLTLRASTAARRALHGRRTRRPVITVRNTDTGGTLTLKAHVK